MDKSLKEENYIIFLLCTFFHLVLHRCQHIIDLRVNLAHDKFKPFLEIIALFIPFILIFLNLLVKISLLELLKA